MLFMRDLSKILNTSFCCILSGLLIWQKAAAQTLTPRFITTTAASNGFYEYLPLGYDPAATQKYPLIVFCHGQGEIGNGTTQLAAILDNGLAQQLDNQVNHNNTQHFPTSFAINGNSFSFIVILPQFNTWPASTDIDNIINYAIANYNVDVGRLYLTGLSMGGGVVWAYAGGASTYANRLAAILPVSGAATLGQGSAQIIASANLPVFATHNSQDPTVPPSYTIDNVNFINSSNPPPNPLAVDSIFPVASPQHDAWTKTYDPTQKLINGLNVYQWMLQYSRLSVHLPLTMLAYTATALPGLPEVRLLDVAAHGVAAASDGEQVMNTAIRLTQVRCIGKAGLAHRTIGGDKEGYLVACALVGAGRNLRIESWTSSAGSGLGVALAARFPIESGAEAVAGVGGAFN